MAGFLYERVHYDKNIKLFLTPLTAVFVDVHIHDEMEVICVLKGDMHVLVNNQKYHLNPGDIIIINAFEPHGTLKGNHDCMHMLLQFNPFEIFSNIDYQKGMRCISYKIDKDTEAHVPLYNSLQELYRVFVSSSNELRIKGHLSILYADMIENLEWESIGTKSKKEESDLFIFQKVIHYICDNYHQPITLEQISKVSGFSTYHFCRFFKRMSGLTFIEYLTNLRLDKAVFSLLTNEKAICKIAYECGFASIKSFNRAFKNAYGISPREYRKRFVSSHVSKT